MARRLVNVFTDAVGHWRGGQLCAADVYRRRRRLDRHYLPDVLCFAIDSTGEAPSQLQDKKPIHDGVTAYICQGMSCQPPLTQITALLDHLKIVNT